LVKVLDSQLAKESISQQQQEEVYGTGVSEMIIDRKKQSNAVEVEQKLTGDVAGDVVGLSVGERVYEKENLCSKTYKLVKSHTNNSSVRTEK
jgi:hypothetical protein